MIDEILKEYQHLSAADEVNRKKRLYYYNCIQCELIANSELTAIVWITTYAVRFHDIVDECENEIELRNRLYK